MSRRPQSGFTLLELIITLSIAAILLGVAAPSFVSVVRDAKLGRVVQPVRDALWRARSEAARGSTEVTVCPRASDTACGTNWNNGLLVFVDGVTVAGETAATRDGGDRVISIIPPHGTDNTLIAVASTDRTADSSYTPNFIRYGASGRSSWPNGTLTACDTRGEAYSRALNVTVTGSIQEARPNGEEDVVRDVFGNTIDCSP